MREQAVDLRPPWLKTYPSSVPAEIETPRYRLLAEAPADLAARRGGASAFTTVMPNGMSGRLSFNDVDRLSDAFAAYLRENLKLPTGARIAVQTPNGLAYPIVAFGIFKAGCTLINVNPLYTATEMMHLFADAQPDAIVAIDMFAEKLADALENAPIPNVVLTSAASLFPAAPRLIIGAVQKYVRKEIPRPRFAACAFAQALAMGAQKISEGADVRAYTAGLDPDAVACLQYTGGTTGVSKAAMLSHRNLIVNVAQFLSFVGGAIREDDHVLTALPLYHCFAFTVNMLGFFFRGAHNVLIPNPRPLVNLRPAFAKAPISFITGVNTLFKGLLHERWFVEKPPQHLRLSVAGGMALHESVAKRWEQVTQTPLIEGYGLSEASPVLTFNPTLRVKPGTIGVPLPWTDIKCVDDNGREVAPGEHGELIARGPQIMSGYWRQPEETRIALRDGWLYTGDIATMDEEGYFTLVDRRKDMILVNGFNVYPNEVEATLTEHPGVKECAVVGVPDAGVGEAVRAFIVRADKSLDAEELRDFCRTRLAPYKIPRHVVFRDDLPKSNVGKILRKDLRGDMSP
ncbi:AMP-dependent synthetase and ligase [Methylocella silvestris BL2]|uniref:3-methylmercaptopropionyl-CoA ligase n=1 Tax=Methylocella silvestris (strain DSM 15510 / CIP 108128 / LMG 27833 / NCIMB 13906 / BL2) TaxID=395965 RepID=B8EP48_METSB|nr:AMP-binding protein [Methylocella silvestris]ACK49286.1 AMP-dependent synthetase and ligase [Methylocella silvestris BL2]